LTPVVNNVSDDKAQQAVPGKINAPVPAVPAIDNKAAGSSVQHLENSIIGIMKTKNEPMSFEEIYAALEKSGISLPADKPKLVVRKLLYNPKRFVTVKGMFTLL